VSGNEHGSVTIVAAALLAMVVVLTIEATVTVRVPVHGLFLVPGTRYAVASARAVVRREGPLTGVRSVAAGQPVGNLLWGPGRTMPQPWRSTLAGR
jgi:hypothetical protein